VRTDHIQLRVFIEGILVSKVSAVSVSGSNSKNSGASLTVPPVPGVEYEGFKRARVHVFYSDLDIRESHDDDDWPLLFEGEIVGDSFSKTSGSRNLSFQCAGYSTYWEQMKLYYYDLSRGGFPAPIAATRINAFFGNSGAVGIDAPVAGANLSSRLEQVFAANSTKSHQSVAVNVLNEAMKEPNGNVFFNKANANLLLDARWMSPKDENIDLLLSRENLLSVMNNDILSVSGQTSLMSIIENTLAVFRYQIICNPQPRLVEDGTPTAPQLVAKFTNEIQDQIKQVLSAGGLGVEDQVSITITSETSNGEIEADVKQAFADSDVDIEDQNLDSLIKTLQSLRDELVRLDAVSGGVKAATVDEGLETKPLLAQYLCLPDTRFAAIPRCNVIFPRDTTSFGMQRDLMAEPTRFITTIAMDEGVYDMYFGPGDFGSSAVVPAGAVPSVARAGMSAPIIGAYQETSGFGSRVHPVTGKVANHQGIDLWASGNVKIRAVDKGTVAFAGIASPTSFAGYQVTIDHANGVRTNYFHLKPGSIPANVVAGAVVESGQVIGVMGQSGRVTGKHLHFEYIKNGVPSNPLAILNATGTSKLVKGKHVFVGVLPEAVDPNSDASGQSLVAESEEQSIESTGGGEGAFTDWAYLTPEEQLSGIVVDFDNDTARAHSIIAQNGDEAAVRRYMTKIVETEFLWRRYQTRSLPQFELPFNPRPVAGFPTLIVDSNRSIIGLVTSVTHSISVGGGGGNASTSVSVTAPRFWDEGDPYAWIGGKEAFKDGGTEDGSESKPHKVPDPEKSSFPAYYMSSLVPTNSHESEHYDVPERFKNGKGLDGDVDRPVDKLYRLILGCGALPYEYGSRTSLATGSNVHYNKAIGTPVGSEDVLPRTVVGHYQNLLDRNPDAADLFVKQFTDRSVVTERQLMTKVLKSTVRDVTKTSYTGDAFRPEIQGLVESMTRLMNGNTPFRG
jgi:hypothetical protein